MSKILDIRQLAYLGESLAPLVKSADSVCYGTEQLQAGNAGFLIPPKSAVSLSASGFCMDHSLPAPSGGQPLRLYRTERMISGQLLPIFRAISEMALKAPQSARYNLQGVVWAIRALDEHPQWDFRLNPEQERFVEIAYPGGMAILRKYNASQKLTSKISEVATQAIRKQFNLSGFGGTTLNPSDPASVQQVLNRIMNPGQTGQAWQSTAGSPYSTLAQQVVARASSPAGLRADIQVLNDSSLPFFFKPSDYIAEAPTQTQRILFDRVIRIDSDGHGSDELPAMERLSKGYLEEVGDIRNWSKGKLLNLFPSLAENSLTNTFISDALKAAVEATPLVGNALSAHEAITGKNWMTGEDLSDAERFLAILGSVPGFGTAEALLKPAGKTVAQVAAPLINKVGKHYQDIANWAISDTAAEIMKPYTDVRLKDGANDAVRRSMDFMAPITRAALSKVAPLYA